MGGYGTFGGRLAGLLADYPDLTLLIAGRNLHKAEQFIARQSVAAKMITTTFDRDGDVLAQISALAPDIVIDASGPYQAYGERPYRVAEAAIALGAHYLDLADGSDFVCNIESLDRAAKDADVFVLAGASTCPVLTMAVARTISDDLISIASVTAGIAPSPFAGMGRSVVEAIAGYAGKQVALIRDGQLQQAYTFASTRNFTIAPPGDVPLAPMTFSLIDVPDLKLLAGLDKPVGNTWFGVATTPAVYHRFLRLLARAVKSGMLPSLGPLAGIMHFVMNKLSWGAHRGGMFVEVRGTDLRGTNVRRSWHLIANGDDGPNVPALAAVAIIRKCIAGRVPASGARPAMNDIGLKDYLPMFRELNINTGERTERSGERQGIFEQVLGDAWQVLPRPVRELHGAAGTSRFAGRASVRRGNGFLAKIVGWLAGFPDARSDIPVAVEISAKGDREIWKRNFDGHTFCSEMSMGGGRFAALMCERFGPAKFGMALITDGDVLRYVARRWTLLGMPMPKWMMPNGDMHEKVVNGKFNFHVEIRQPMVGHVVTYQGWLDSIPTQLAVDGQRSCGQKVPDTISRSSRYTGNPYHSTRELLSMNRLSRSTAILCVVAGATGCTNPAAEATAYEFRNDDRPVYENSVDLNQLEALKQKGATVIDVRLIEDFKANPTLIPDSMYEDPEKIETWAANMSRDEPVVVYCVRGKWVSQKAANYLKDKGFEVYTLEGGIEAWQAAGRETVSPAE